MAAQLSKVQSLVRCAARSRREGNMPSQAKRKVVVIGAGWSGIAAARKLLEADGVDVTVLEASSRVGGRAMTVKLPHVGPVEYGATWFHGVLDNPVYDLAVRHGLMQDIRFDPATMDQEPNWGVTFVKPGDPQPMAGSEAAAAQQAMEAYSEVVEAAGLSSRSSSGGILTGSGSCEPVLGDVLRDRFGKAVAELRLEGAELRAFASAWAARDRLQCAFDGLWSTDDCSLAMLREYVHLEGPDIPVPGGYEHLARLVAADLPVQFNTRVTRIIWQEQQQRQQAVSGAAPKLTAGANSAHSAHPDIGTSDAAASAAAASAPPPAVVIETASGSSYHADAVIVTVSLGVLKATQSQLFHPPLPPHKATAIEQLPIGIVNKVFLEFVPLQEQQQGAQNAQHTQTLQPHAQQAQEKPQPRDAEAANKRRKPAAADGDDSGPEQPQKAAAAADIIASDHAGNVLPPQDDMVSYMLMWPTDPAVLGPKGLQPDCPQHDTANGNVGNGNVGSGRGAKVCAAWLRSLNSFRYGPGPEWTRQAADTGIAADGPVRENSYGCSNDSNCQAVAASNLEAVAAPGDAPLGAVLWVTGEAAVAMEQRTDEQVTRDVVQLLSSFPAIPTPAGTAVVLHVHRSCWGADPLYRGAYSYLGRGCTGETVTRLAEPLCDAVGQPVVCFAGEATTAEHIGTVHGAFLSGEREAERLLTAFNV